MHYAGRIQDLRKGVHDRKKAKMQKLMIFMNRLINARSSFCGKQVVSRRSLVACVDDFGENSHLIKRAGWVSS